MLAPAGTPKHIIDKLAKVMMKATQSEEFKRTLIPQGAVLIGNTPEQFKAELQAEVAHWGEQFKKFNVEK